MLAMQKPAIYAIIHHDSKRLYVGSAHDYSRRWRQHRSLLNRGLHQNPHLQSAWSCYGADAFQFVVIQALDTTAEILELEQFWIDKLKPAFNAAPIAGSPMAGRKHTAEALAKMSEASKTRMLDPEERKRRGRPGHKKAPGHGANVAAALVKGYELTSPDGVKQIVRNLKQFCRDHNMSSSNFSMVARGVWRHYKGWKCRYLTSEEREALFTEPPATT